VPVATSGYARRAESRYDIIRQTAALERLYDAVYAAARP
jgi:hypothetical protein